MTYPKYEEVGLPSDIVPVRVRRTHVTIYSPVRGEREVKQLHAAGGNIVTDRNLIVRNENREIQYSKGPQRGPVRDKSCKSRRLRI